MKNRVERLLGIGATLFVLMLVYLAYVTKQQHRELVIQEISFDLSKRAECQSMGGEMVLKWSQRHNQFVLDACKVGALR